MFCTACAATNTPGTAACAACGAGIRSATAPSGRFPTARPGGGREDLLRALYAVPFALLLAVGGFAAVLAWNEQQAKAAAYERGVLAALAGDHLAARSAFAAAGPYADATAQEAVVEAALAPARAAYLDGVAAIEAGDYAAAIAALLPVARDIPDLGDVTTRLADARRLEAERLWRLVETADARRDWTAAEAHLRALAVLDPADPAVAARLTALGRDHGPLILTRDRSLWLASPDGGDAVLLAEEVDALWPAWSPDRSQVAYLAIDPQSSSGLVSLMLLDVAGGQPRRLADQVSAHAAPVWSPDGRSLAFTSFADFDPFLDEGPIAVHVVDAATGRETDVTGARYDLAFNPAWSPDGRQLAFVAKTRAMNERPQHAPGDVWVTTLGGGEFRNLTVGAIRDAWSVHWHPGGGPLLVFSLYGQSWYEPPVTAIRRLWPGERPELVSSLNEQVGAPAWSPDGRRFAYTVDETSVRVVDLEAGGASVLHEAAEPLAGEITWAPDGSALLAAALSGRRASTLVAFDEAGTAAASAVPIEYDSDPPYFGPPQWASTTVAAPADERSLGGTGLDHDR